MRLLHPMMPFLTEELYQKLPQFQNKAKSITKAPYPTPLDEGKPELTEYFNQIQTEFEIINKSAAALRSISSSVNLPPQIKPNAFLLTADKILASQTDLLATLGKCSNVKLIQDEK